MTVGMRSRWLPWLDVPFRGWQVRRLKHLSPKLSVGVVVEPSSYFASDGTIPMLLGSHIRPYTVDASKAPRITPASNEVLAKSKLRSGDLVTVRVGAPGVTAVIPPELDGCNCASLVFIRRHSSFDSRWLAYAMNSGVGLFQVELVQYGAAQKCFNIAHAVDFAFPTPPPAQQRAIADFLDEKTAALDALIAKKARLVELQQEKRQALITFAMTKGLETNVTMKDSDVEWLGEIPAHWEVLSLTRVVQRFVDYRGRTPEKTDEGVPLITAGAVRNGRVEHSRAPEFVTEDVYRHLNQRGHPEVGDILFTSEAPLGEVAMVEDPRVACAQRIIMFKVDRAVMNPEFLLWYFLSAPGRTEIASRASGSTAEGIRADRLRMAAVLVPPLAEQERCVAWLRDQLVWGERIEPVLSRQIDRLREYRQALITEAVTGKLDIAQEADRDSEVMVRQALEAAP